MQQQIDYEVKNNIINNGSFDGTNGYIAWWVVYFVKNDENIFFTGIPQDWIITYSGQSGIDLFEIQFWGHSQDRMLVKTILEQNLNDLKLQNKITEWYIRPSIAPSTDRDGTYESYDHHYNNPNNRRFMI